MSDFVSGLPGPTPERPTLVEALKSLEAGVKGYGKPMTAASKAYDARRTGEREDPNAGWHPVLTQDELLDARLRRVPLVDTSRAEQLELF